jgi:hypothetical protein
MSENHAFSLVLYEQSPRLLELGHVICIGHTLYVLAVSGFGHPERFATIPQSLGVSTILNALVAMCGTFSLWMVKSTQYMP